MPDYLLVPKLLLGDPDARKALLCLSWCLRIELAVPKQSLGYMGVPKRKLGTRCKIFAYFPLF
jgi:hypothetical protein